MRAVIHGGAGVGSAVLVAVGLVSPAAGQDHSRHEMPPSPMRMSGAPASSPSSGVHLMRDGWSLMFHGDATVGYAYDPSPRGARDVLIANMLMARASRPVGSGSLSLTVMTSLEPVMGPAGYPLLFQTGETADGVTPLVDRQHPHDLFMELSARFDVNVTSRLAVFAYVAPVGSAGLGPVPFMHRGSSRDNPAAPLAHHFLDATHVVHGVVRSGVVIGETVTLEGSVFNGREPDQRRWNVDRLRLDSYALRVMVEPHADWVFQGSAGRINSPEAIEPDEDVVRLTASVMHSRRLAWGHVQSLVALGVNAAPGGGAPTRSALLLESTVKVRRTAVFTRIERAAPDHLFDEDDPRAEAVLWVGKVSLGAVHDIRLAGPVQLGAGVAGSLHFVSGALESEYGPNLTSVQVFGRIGLR